MQEYYYNRVGIRDRFQGNRWESVVFKEFEAALMSKTRPFPCVFGVAGFQQDQLRYCFNEELVVSDIALSLEHFIKHSREYGQNTSLVIFSKPCNVETVKSYEKRFWSIISELAAIDQYEWPQDIPRSLDNPLWEFCFAGEPIFVVCNTPAHVLRQSRRASSFMITFQPRWVFNNILGTPELAKKSSGKVQARLKPFDLISPSPHLGSYGSPENREFSQYFLHENNDQVKCPFHQLPEKNINKIGVA